MTREVDALGLDPRPPRRVEIENSQRRGQAATALGHVDDVGIGRIVMVQQVAVQPQVRGHGLGQGIIRAFATDPLSQPFGGVIGQGPDRLRVAERIVVDGAGNRGLEQRKGLVLGLSSLGQQGDRVFAGHAPPLPKASTPRRWRGNRPGASATISIRSR